MATKINYKNYRDELVQQIKEIGQELIDRAEDMVSVNTDLITDFYINIHFIENGIPEISFDTSVLSKNTIKRHFY